MDPMDRIDELEQELARWRSYARKWQDIAKEKDRNCAELRRRAQKADQAAQVARTRAENLLARYGQALEEGNIQ